MKYEKRAQTENTYNKAKLVEAVDDVQQRSLATFIEVRSLEQRCCWDSVRLGSIVEVLDVSHRDEAA